MLTLTQLDDVKQLMKNKINSDQEFIDILLTTVREYLIDPNQVDTQLRILHSVNKKHTS